MGTQGQVLVGNLGQRGKSCCQDSWWNLNGVCDWRMTLYTQRSSYLYFCTVVRRSLMWFGDKYILGCSRAISCHVCSSVSNVQKKMSNNGYTSTQKNQSAYMPIKGREMQWNMNNEKSGSRDRKEESFVLYLRRGCAGWNDLQRNYFFFMQGKKKESPHHGSSPRPFLLPAKSALSSTPAVFLGTLQATWTVYDPV